MGKGRRNGAVGGAILVGFAEGRLWGSLHPNKHW